MWNAAKRLASAASLALTLLSSCRPRSEQANSTEVGPARTPTTPTVESVVAQGHSFGPGKTFGVLTVYPVLAKSQPDLGEFTTLDEALAAKSAEVREQEGGGTVNALVLENKGKKAVFVLAGTVVKGGKQDRQISQDFVVGSGETVAVDAFCVEHGRWTPERQGQMTQGKFGTMQTLANSQVRAAGQHKKSQSEVWEKVAETNAVNGKTPSTGTLAASIEDGDLAEKRKALAAQVSTHFEALEPQREIVGVAYAVGGQVKGVRWFANHTLFNLYRSTLLNTAALEAVTAPRPAAGAKRAEPPSPAGVEAFVTEVSKAKTTEERDTRADNVNEYQESTSGYGSKTRLKSPPKAMKSAAASATASPAAAAPAPVDLSVDIVAK